MSLQMRNRRPAQRRQVHPVQRPHQGRHRSGELSLLHHRAQRRHRRSARPAHGCAGRHRQAAEGAARRSSSSSTSPAWWRARRKGEGLGNQFLANIRETDAIAHVVRCFEDDNVIHVAGKVDPISDIEVINTELALADLETVEKAVLRTNQAGQVRRQGSEAHVGACWKKCAPPGPGQARAQPRIWTRKKPPCSSRCA